MEKEEKNNEEGGCVPLSDALGLESLDRGSAHRKGSTIV
jgi:hypothetical protein